MNRQVIFDDFLKTVNGRGRSLMALQPGHPRQSVYFPENDHPGCAIGCQPDFRKRFEHMAHQIEGKSISAVCGEFHDIQTFFGAEHVCDRNFLDHLQTLHDLPSNWLDNGLNLRPEVVEAFKRQHLLV